MTEKKSEIICLVGSVKQVDDWRKWEHRLTAQGYIVFGAGVYGVLGENITEETWEVVTRVHFRKIEISDVVAVIRKPDGTIGNHTAADVRHALNHHKSVSKVESVYLGVFSDW